MGIIAYTLSSNAYVTSGLNVFFIYNNAFRVAHNLTAGHMLVKVVRHA